MMEMCINLLSNTKNFSRLINPLNAVESISKKLIDPTGKPIQNLRSDALNIIKCFICLWRTIGIRLLSLCWNKGE